MLDDRIYDADVRGIGGIYRRKRVNAIRLFDRAVDELHAIHDAARLAFNRERIPRCAGVERRGDVAAVLEDVTERIGRVGKIGGCRKTARTDDRAVNRPIAAPTEAEPALVAQRAVIPAHDGAAHELDAFSIGVGVERRRLTVLTDAVYDAGIAGFATVSHIVVAHRGGTASGRVNVSDVISLKARMRHFLA